MKKSFVIMGIILLLVGAMIIVSTHENQTQKKDPYTVTTPGGTSISIVSIPQAQSKAPDLQEVMGYIFGGGILFAGGYLLLNSKQKKLLDNKD